MNEKLPLVDHWSVEPGDFDALIALYNATPVAKLPENWKEIQREQMDQFWEADGAVKDAHTDADYQAALPGKPVKITLPEIMQCFKTLVHFDWVEELGRDLVADGVLDIPHEDFWVSSWPLDDPFIRGCATGLLDSFLHWWPIWCGHDVMTGRLGGRNFNYYSVMAPVYRGVLLKITYDDMCMVFDRKNLGGVVGLLQKYGAQK